MHILHKNPGLTYNFLNANQYCLLLKMLVLNYAIPKLFSKFFHELRAKSVHSTCFEILLDGRFWQLHVACTYHAHKLQFVNHIFFFLL